MSANPIPDPTQQPTPSTGGKVRDFASGIFQGLAGAAGNQGLYDRIAAQRKEQRDQVGAGQQMSIQAHALAVKGLRQKLAQLDPQKDAQAYQQTVDQIQANIHAMREIVNPDQQLPAGEWLKTHLTDRMHITNHDARVKQLQAKQQAGVGQDQQTAQALAQGTVAVPQFLTPEEQAEAARIKAGLDPKAGVMTATGLHHADYLAYKKDHPEDRRSEEEWVQAEAAKGRASAPMSEQQKALDDYRKASLAAKMAQQAAAQNPNNPLYRLRLQAAQTAQENARTRALSEEGRMKGTQGGVPMAGDLLDSEGDIVPPVNATNVRPTGTQRERATLATSALEQTSDVLAVLKAKPGLFGPGGGQITNINQWLGTSDPDAQAVRVAAGTAADHLAGVFGGRNKEALQFLHEVAGGKVTMNPEAMAAGIEQLNKAAKTIQSVGSYRTVGGGAASPTGNSSSPTPKAGTGSLVDRLNDALGGK